MERIYFLWILDTMTMEHQSMQHLEYQLNYYLNLVNLAIVDHGYDEIDVQLNLSMFVILLNLFLMLMYCHLFCLFAGLAVLIPEIQIFISFSSKMITEDELTTVSSGDRATLASAVFHASKLV